MKAMLALSDGTVLEGRGFGAEKETAGEVVFNTSFVGYEESLTDPSYKGQILTLTYPLIGNYGVRKDRFESDRIQPEGFVVREKCGFHSHRNAEGSIDSFLKKHGIPGISEIDTRLLTKKIRTEGVMNGALAVSRHDIDKEHVLELAGKRKNISEIDLLDSVSTKRKTEHNCNGKKTIALIDCGVKQSIMRSFLERKINIIQLPHTTRPDEIAGLKADGLFISNGPGDPKQAVSVIKLIKDLQGEYPIAGICLGHQIISLALGADTYKLKFGHRGSNQPVKNLKENKVYITSQNHGFAVDADSLDRAGLETSMINLNDGSVEAVAHWRLNIQAVQFHPEANPGPWDCRSIFDDFIKALK